MRVLTLLSLPGLILLSLSLLCPPPATGGEEREPTVWVKVTERGLSPQAFVAKYFPHHYRQGYTWRDLIREDGKRVRNPRRDFTLYRYYTLSKGEKPLRRRYTLVSLADTPSPQWLQKRYEQLYGLSQSRHDQRYAAQRHHLQSLYQSLLQTEGGVRQQVWTAEQILAPFGITLLDILLAMAKVESNYNPLAIGAHGEAGLFQLAPRYAHNKGLKVYHWKKYLADVKRYGESRARKRHSRDLRRLLRRYRQRYATPGAVRRELMKVDDRFHPRQVVRLLMTELAEGIRWLQTEEMTAALPLLFIEYNG
ncbi:MAG: hypothetical protein D6736_06860, partial [Nitrospinota bacterium]